MLAECMEVLHRLTRKQLTVLEKISIYRETDNGVSLKMLAASLRIQPPSALFHVRALQNEGLVGRRAGKTWITKKGVNCISEYRRHHRIAELMFTKLSFAPEDACRAALEIDLALTHATVEKVCSAEGHPSSCPHGEPIGPCRNSSDKF